MNVPLSMYPQKDLQLMLQNKMTLLILDQDLDDAIEKKLHEYIVNTVKTESPNSFQFHKPWIELRDDTAYISPLVWDENALEVFLSFRSWLAPQLNRKVIVAAHEDMLQEHFLGLFDNIAKIEVLQQGDSSSIDFYINFCKISSCSDFNRIDIPLTFWKKNLN